LIRAAIKIMSGSAVISSSARENLSGPEGALG
jgi:hypothetical protein